MPWLWTRGFTGVGLEISAPVAEVAQEIVRPFAPDLRIVEEYEALEDQRFDYVIALEVLEHIEDDTAALEQWLLWLKAGGYFLLSVPSRMRLWTAADEAVGHFRRYERESLMAMLSNLGLEIEKFWSYGFPLRILTLPFRAIRGRLSPRADLSRQDRTLRSALDSTVALRSRSRWVRFGVEAAVSLLHVAQTPFLGTDLGDGYLVLSRLRRE